jgi:hypothetical protein
MDEWDASNNSTNRRYDRGRVYVTDERHVEVGDIAVDRDQHERFYLNQYYNAVEDEQLYMDEYTSLVQRYNDFIVNSNTLFTRMEMTLRENITRAVTRQTFYYRQSDYTYQREIRRALEYRRNHVDPAVPAVPAPQTVPTVSTTTPSTPLQPNQRPVQRIGDSLPRLVSRYIDTENSRQQRQNIFSMLYTFPVDLAAGARGAHTESSTTGPPTNEQINRATLNTTFANILSPVNATCPISRDEFNDESEITMIRGCNHVFNRVCLREWFVNHPTCPLCRGDIRQYRPPSIQEPLSSQSESNRRENTNIPRNISIDSADRDHVTFSYDLPSHMNNEDMYRNLINTVTNMITTSQENQNRNNEDDDDIMEVD